MRVAVTGAFGFIGRQVVGELLANGHVVIAVDRDDAPLSTMPWRDRVETVVGDIGDPSLTFVRIGAPDALVHLAWARLDDFRALAHVADELPRHLGFLMRMVEAGLSRMTVAGTCLEYGLQSGALHEALPTAPVTAYGLGKDALRRALELLRQTHPFSLGWGRLFYMHGAASGRRTLLLQLRDAVARGDHAFPMSGGEQLRDYLSVEAVGAQLARLAVADDPGIVNICSGAPISVRRLVEGWIAEHGWTIALDLGAYPYPDYEPLAFWGDRAKAERVLARPLAR